MIAAGDIAATLRSTGRVRNREKSGDEREGLTIEEGTQIPETLHLPKYHRIFGTLRARVDATGYL